MKCVSTPLKHKKLQKEGKNDREGATKGAKFLGVKTAGLRKTEMIRAIQTAEGNFDCFGTAVGYCDQVNCLFRKDCLGI